MNLGPKDRNRAGGRSVQGQPRLGRRRGHGRSAICAWHKPHTHGDTVPILMT